MKKEKIIKVKMLDDYPLVKSHLKKEYKGKLYEYKAGITRHDDENMYWIWQGIVVASNVSEAYALLKLFVIDKFAVSALPQSYDIHINEGIKAYVSKRAHGVYGI